jgi:hypothetical protein
MEAPERKSLLLIKVSGLAARTVSENFRAISGVII